MIGAMWASFSCILVLILGGANSDTIVYAGRSALMSYSPARGEFPVQSLIGRGYFSYVDQNGNSNIVSLEPNQLLGVRVSASGQPLDESVGENLAKATDDNSNKDRLKPIKEFDETPFVDSVNEKDVNLQSTMVSDLKNDSLPSQLISKATDAGQQIFLYQLPAGAKTGRQAGAGVFNPQNPFLPHIFPDSSVTTTVLPKPSVFPKPLGNGAQNPFLFPNMGLVFANPSPVISAEAESPSSSEIEFSNQFGDTSEDNFPSTTTPQADIPDILFPNSPLIAGSDVFLPAEPFTTSAPSTVDISSSPNVFLAPSPDLPFPNENDFTSSVFPNPSPPSASPTTTQNLPQPCTSPSIIVSGSQYIANNKNPFLPQRTSLDSQASALSLTDIETIANSINAKSSISGRAISSLPLDDEIAIPKQVTDTPEVEEAKREHFLAHQLALAQLELAEQTSNKEYESSSPSLSVAASSSVYLPPAVASFQAVTSGPSTVVITQQTKLAGAESVTVSQES